MPRTLTWVVAVILHSLAIGQEDVMATSMVILERVMTVLTLGCSFPFWNSFALRWEENHSLSSNQALYKEENFQQME